MIYKKKFLCCVHQLLSAVWDGILDHLLKLDRLAIAGKKSDLKGFFSILICFAVSQFVCCHAVKYLDFFLVVYTKKTWSAQAP